MALHLLYFSVDVSHEPCLYACTCFFSTLLDKMCTFRVGSTIFLCFVFLVITLIKGKVEEVELPVEKVDIIIRFVLLMADAPEHFTCVCMNLTDR